MSSKDSELYKELVRIEVMAQFPILSRGRPRKVSFEETYHNILFLLRTGMQWRYLTPQSVSFITIFKTIHKWISRDIFRTAYNRLLLLYRKKRRTRFYCIDSSHVKNVYGRDCKGRNHSDRGRMSTKLSTIVDDMGIPFTFHVAPGNTSDMKLMVPLLESNTLDKRGKIELFADKGYDSKANRQSCRDMGFRDRILKRKCKHSQRTHSRRIVVEHFFSWHDKYRRLILRYEQKIQVYLGFTFLACGVLLGRRISF